MTQYWQYNAVHYTQCCRTMQCTALLPCWPGHSRLLIVTQQLPLKLFDSHFVVSRPGSNRWNVLVSQPGLMTPWQSGPVDVILSVRLRWWHLFGWAWLMIPLLSDTVGTLLVGPDWWHHLPSKIIDMYFMYSTTSILIGAFDNVQVTEVVG